MDAPRKPSPLTRLPVERIANGLLVVLWIATTAVAVAWMFAWDVPFDPEPVTVVLGLATVGITALVGTFSKVIKDHREQLELEKFSLADALAYGYVNNFLEPAIAKLLTRPRPKGVRLEFFIYIPEDLSELSPHSVTRIRAKIQERAYDLQVLQLDFDEGRVRDLLTVFKTGSGDARYFDFPSTLLTLESLIAHKLRVQPDRYAPHDKAKLGRAYIERFRESLIEEATRRHLMEYLRFTDRTLTGLD